MSLFRTTASFGLSLVAIAGGKKGIRNIDKSDPDSIAKAAAEAVAAARASQADPANDLAPRSEPRRFSSGPEAPDREGMYDRLEEFLATAKRNHPMIKLEQCILDFTRAASLLANSNGVSMRQDKGIYGFGTMYTAKEGLKTSSFNGGNASSRGLGRPLGEWGDAFELMRQTEGQLDTIQPEGKFEGEIVVSAHCLGSILYSLYGYLGNGGLISGTSPYKDSLGKAVASACFTLRSIPASVEDGYGYTSDGFAAEDCAIIDGGKLSNFFLDLYGSRKTGLPRCPSGGGCLSVDSGGLSRDELITGVRRGILLCRFSGGAPSDNGDFSGVAKNSYLIEEGRVTKPLSETMISGNLVAVLKAISGVSRERVDFGGEAYPWVRAGGVTISGSAKERICR